MSLQPLNKFQNRTVRKDSDIREVHCSGLLAKLFDYHQSSQLIDITAQYSFRSTFAAFPDNFSVL